MAELPPTRRPLTVDEYLAFDDASEIRYEYIEGELFAGAGAGWWHNRIVGNILARLHTAAGDGPCTPFATDMKLRAAERVFYYPDVVVTCDPEDIGNPLVAHPCLIVEVQSPSTEAIDRREKLLAYHALPSLQAYLVVASDQRHVVLHWRDAETLWQRTDLIGDGVMAIPCPASDLSLAEIYRGVDVPAE
jgi:Uma2 family endonuclease